MDRGYLDRARLYAMHQAGAFFVTRAKSNFSARRLYSASVEKTTGVVFLGTSQNAVKSQIWCAICTYVLIALVKNELHLNSSLYTCLQILSVSVFEKTLISCALQTDDYKTQLPPDANQLILLGF